MARPNKSNEHDIDHNHNPITVEEVQYETHAHLDRQFLEIMKEALLAGVEVTPKDWIKKQFKDWKKSVSNNHARLRKLGEPINWWQYELDEFDKVSQLQRLFEGSKYDCGKPTGILTSSLQKAVKAFQTDWNSNNAPKKLPQDGRITIETLKELSNSSLV